ncbi:MAG TPA: restriction endonuclease subunit S [Candidatus Hydrogenedentes bacterium]|nr:restriction endonuclease subunit S [Candidatus Hydrogenedentota bacterium]
MAMETLTLGEICDKGGGTVRTGPFGSQLHQSDYQDEGIPVVMPKDILEGTVSEESIARIGQEDAERLSQHRLMVDDIVYGRRGDIGRHAFIREHQEGWLCGTGCLRISLGKSVLDPLFLHYYLEQDDVIGWIGNQAIGATMPNLNTSILRSLPISYPPRKIQNKIASILGAYDDLIENNLRRIKILEEMAQNLYREWFVNFRFPGHKSLPKVDSPLGPIPKGWKVKSFTDVVDVMSGGTPSKKNPEFWDGEIPFFTPSDTPLGFYVTDTEDHITKLGLSKCSSNLYPKNTVFITARGTVGKVVMPFVDMAMNQSCYALVGKEGYDQLFVFFLTLASVEYLKKNTGGATFATIIVDTFRRFQIIVPLTSLVSKFALAISPMIEIIGNLVQKNTNLRMTRDFLLPRLISGEAAIADIDDEEGKTPCNQYNLLYTKG